MAIDLISAVVEDGSDVPKAGFRAFVNNRMAHRMADADELRGLDLSGVLVVIVGAALYARDTSDTTSVDDGATVLVDAGGSRWIRQAVTVSGLTFKGPYAGGTTYSAGHVVTDGNASWVYHNVTPGSGHAPPTFPTLTNSYWQYLAGQGPEAADVVTSTDIDSIVALTQAEYDALSSPVATTLYLIKE